MIDTTRIFDQLLGTGGDLATRAGVPQQTVEQVKTVAKQNPLLVGGLAGLLLGGLTRNAPGLGGAAIVGGLAWKAYRDWQARTAGAGDAAPNLGEGPILLPPSDSPFAPANVGRDSGAFAEALILAMIAAARADGEIDAEERRRIEERLEKGGLSDEELVFVRGAMEGPVDIEKIVRAADSKEAATELFTVSLMAAPPDTATERGYFAMLAGRLRLEPELVASIEKTLEGATT
jgi:uncharacterized membrane protein YebE (DUF533 family)